MVREGPALNRRILVSIAWLSLAILDGRALAQAPEPKAEPIDRTPYAIRMLIDFDLDAQVDLARGDAILDEWYDLVHRFVGSPWSPEVVQIWALSGNPDSKT